MSEDATEATEEPVEEEQTEEDKLRHQQRVEIVAALDGAWLGSSGSAREWLKERRERLAEIEAGADVIRAEIRGYLEDAAKTWDKAVGQLRLPTRRGSVIAHTKSRNTEELIVNLGDDEWFVIRSDGTRHHLKPTYDGIGHRHCYEVGCPLHVFIPPMPLAVIPPMIPADIQKVIAEMGKLAPQ